MSRRTWAPVNTAACVVFGGPALVVVVLSSLRTHHWRYLHESLLVVMLTVLLSSAATVLIERRWLRARIIGAAAALSVAGVLIFQATGPSLAELEAQGNRMLETLRAFESRNGPYPGTLEDAGIPADTRFGPWRYTKPVGSGGLRLSIGDYGTDESQTWWDSESGGWRRGT